jgi:hypothetical protein
VWVGELEGFIQDCKQGMEANEKKIKGRREWMIGGQTRFKLRPKARYSRG